MLGSPSASPHQPFSRRLLLVKPIEGIPIDPNKDIIPIEGFTI
jgi:hypothetical protein